LRSNSEFKKLITTAIPQANFFELFNEQKIQVLRKVFSDVRLNETAVRDKISIERDSIALDYEVEISMMRSENNAYYLINFS